MGFFLFEIAILEEREGFEPVDPVYRAGICLADALGAHWTLANGA